MTKSELVRKIKEHSKEDNLNYRLIDIEDIVDRTLNEISMAFLVDDKVVLSGFGTFEKNYQEGYVGVNPATGESIKVPGNYKIRFTVSKKVKEQLKETKK